MVPQARAPGPEALPHSRTSLSRQMALTLLPLVLVPLLLLAGAGYLRTRTILRDVVSRRVTTATQSQGVLIGTWVEERQQELLVSSQRRELREALAAILPNPSRAGGDRLDAARAELTAILSQAGRRLFSELLVLDHASGQILVATNRNWDLQSTALSTDDLEGLTGVGTLPSVDDPLLAPESLALLTVVPLRSGRTESADLLLVGVNRGLTLGQLLEDLQVFTERQGIFIIRRGLSSVLIPPDSLVRVTGYAGVYELMPQVEHPVLQTAQTPEITTLEYDALDGTPVLAAYQWHPAWGLAIVNELPQSEVYADLLSLAPFTAAILGVTVVLTVLIVALVTGRMLRPLGRLTEFAGRMSRGEWDFRVPEERPDEIGHLAASLNRMADDLSGMYRSLEARVEERTRQVRTAAEVAHAVTSTPDLADLLRRAVETIADRFGYQHAAIYLLDDRGEQALLREATGEAGAVLVARRHRIAVGSPPAVGWATANNQPRVIADGTRETAAVRSELMPGARAQAVVPLRAGGRVLGALDVQSSQPSSFSPEDLAVLQTLADQVSASILNARLAQASSVAADRARLIAAVTSQVAGHLELEDVLKTTARALHQALGRSEVAIRLLPPGGERIEPAPRPSGAETP